MGAIVGLTAGVASTLFYSLGSFIPPLQAAYGWSRGAISLALTIAAAATFLLGSVAGRLCDRYGSRRVATASLVAYGLGLVTLALSVSRVEHLWIGYFVVALLENLGFWEAVADGPVGSAVARIRSRN